MIKELDKGCGDVGIWEFGNLPMYQWLIRRLDD